MNYYSHWGLTSSPFHKALAGKAIHQGPAHREALARLHFLTDERRHLGLLLGNAGSGKTRILEAFADEIRREGQPVAELNLLGLDREEFLPLLAAGLEVRPARGGSTSLWQRILNRLAEFRYQRARAAILFDDAHQASPEVLAQIVRLIKGGGEAGPTIVLAAETQRIGALGDDLLELAELRIDVEPWDQADTEVFLRASLAESPRAAAIFDEEAIARLHELAEGLPRRVIQIADLALLAGAGRDLERIDAETIESACRELGAV
jgi:general secretion pathway protein A